MERWDKKLAGVIDHTLLKSQATEKDVRKLCSEACKYGFASVVVFPTCVSLARELLAGSQIPVCSVVSFPFGANLPKEKGLEIESLLKSGATELDMVMNISAFLSRNFSLVEEELKIFSSLCIGSALTKVIIETCFLEGEDIKRASAMIVEAGIDYVKTSTGFGPRGVSTDDVRIISSAVGKRARIKASGGIRTKAFALELLKEGASRLGCSHSLNVISI